MTEKPTVCVDFDGVLNMYDGWQGESELFKPRPGVRRFLDELSSKYTVVILTARDPEKVENWLRYHRLNYDDVTNIKVPAIAYIDDRAIKFNGSFEGTLSKLKRFKTHWEY